jgi:hypothetical protein
MENLVRLSGMKCNLSLSALGTATLDVAKQEKRFCFTDACFFSSLLLMTLSLSLTLFLLDYLSLSLSL